MWKQAVHNLNNTMNLLGHMPLPCHALNQLIDIHTAECTDIGVIKQRRLDLANNRQRIFHLTNANKGLGETSKVSRLFALFELFCTHAQRIANWLTFCSHGRESAQNMHDV